MSKTRQTNIELCRIVAILLVLLVHSGVVSFGDIGKYDSSYRGILIMESFSIVCVNLFILISGYFSISLRWQSVLRLVWICVFYGLISVGMSYLLGFPVSYKSFLFVSGTNWFIATYIGLMLCSPMLNVFAEKATRNQLGYTIIILLAFQTWYDYIPRLMSDFQHGYSILSFSILYLMARYIRLYGMPMIIRKYNIYIYIVISLIISAFLIFSVEYGFHPRGFADLLLRYSNPLVICSAISLFSYFESKKINNSKAINYIALSCVAVFLFHRSSFCVGYVNSLFRDLFFNHSGILVIIGWSGIILGEFFVAVIVDQVRLLIERMVLFLYSRNRNRD